MNIRIIYSDTIDEKFMFKTVKRLKNVFMRKLNVAREREREILLDLKIFS